MSGGGPNVDCQRTVGSSDVELQEGLVEPASLLAQDNTIKIYSIKTLLWQFEFDLPWRLMHFPQA